MSSQRAESTNRSLCMSLPKSTRLHSFYKNFKKVCEIWRQNENDEDFRNLKGKVPMKYNVDMLEQAREIYTSKVFLKFQENFGDSLSCSHEMIIVIPGMDMERYHVMRDGIDVSFHQVCVIFLYFLKIIFF